MVSCFDYLPPVALLYKEFIRVLRFTVAVETNFCFISEMFCLLSFGLIKSESTFSTDTLRLQDFDFAPLRLRSACLLPVDFSLSPLLFLSVTKFS